MALLQLRNCNWIRQISKIPSLWIFILLVFMWSICWPWNMLPNKSQGVLSEDEDIGAISSLGRNLRNINEVNIIKCHTGWPVQFNSKEESTQCFYMFNMKPMFPAYLSEESTGRRTTGVLFKTSLAEILTSEDILGLLFISEEDPDVLGWFSHSLITKGKE